MTDTNADIKKMTFETAMKELEDIVQRLEAGNVELEQAVSIYERGEALKQRCEQLLKKASDKVEKIKLGADGSASGTEPMDAG